MERIIIREINKLHLGITLNNPLNYAICISRDESVVLSNQSPVSIACQKIAPHIYVAEHASLFSCRRGTTPALTKGLTIKICIGQMVIPVIYRGVSLKIPSRSPNREKRVKTIRAVQTQDIFQESRHAFSPLSMASIARPYSLYIKRRELCMSCRSVDRTTTYTRCAKYTRVL